MTVARFVAALGTAFCPGSARRWTGGVTREVRDITSANHKITASNNQQCK
jgi:hypothetical protein